MENEPTKPKTNDAVSGRVEPIVMRRCGKCGGKASSYSQPTHNVDFIGYFCSCDACDYSVGDIDSGDYSLTEEEAIDKWDEDVIDIRHHKFSDIDIQGAVRVMGCRVLIDYGDGHLQIGINDVIALAKHYRLVDVDV